MTIEQEFLTNTFKVGHYTVRLWLPIPPEPGELLEFYCEWKPELPVIQHFSERERQQYLKGREALMEKLLETVGGFVMEAQVSGKLRPKKSG
jgi:hypothetical protein